MLETKSKNEPSIKKFRQLPIRHDYQKFPETVLKELKQNTYICKVPSTQNIKVIM